MGTSKEFGNNHEIMPARTEAGFFFSPTEIENVRQKLENIGYQRVNYENPYTQTVYFAQKSGQTPDGGYIRIRRYVDSPSSEKFEIAPDSIWYLEGKISGGAKERLVLQTNIILQVLGDPIHRELIKENMPGTYNMLSEVRSMFPVAATQWLREHYILDDQNRATIDSVLTYFAFVPGNAKGEPMGQDAGSRIEWKTLNGLVPSNQFDHINLIPIPPKWHEATIRKMYIEWLSNFVNKNE